MPLTMDASMCPRSYWNSPSYPKLPTMYRYMYCVLLSLVVSGIRAHTAEPLLPCGEAFYQASQVCSYQTICDENDSTDRGSTRAMIPISFAPSSMGRRR